MELSSDFTTFLSEIRFTDRQRNDLRDGHKLLRSRLTADENITKIMVSDFLQGSYKRQTAVRPKGDSRADVDIIVVTKLDESEYTPQEAMNLFVPFLKKNYPDKWQFQGRSIGIELSLVDFDLVLTSAPSETEYGILQSDAVKTDDDIEEAVDWRLNSSWLSLANREGRADAARLMVEAAKQPEWKAKPLRIPDRDAKIWDDTHPIEQIVWTREKNRRNNGHFINIVKSIKWWRLVNYEKPEKPKGFPLERIVGDCCPDNISSIGHGIVLTLEAIVSRYQTYIATGKIPQLPDYGVPSHNVLKKLSFDDFKAFYTQAMEGATLARSAYDSQDRIESGKLWRDLLGDKFPEPPSTDGSKKTGYTKPSEPAVPSSGRFG